MDQLQQRLMFDVFRSGWRAALDQALRLSILWAADEQCCSDAFTRFVEDNGLGEEGLTPEAREALYNVAKKIMHSLNQPWIDPRTGVTYPPSLKDIHNRG